MEINECVKKLVELRFLEPIYEYVLKHIIDCNLEENEKEYLKVFALYFTYISSGSACMPLGEDTLKKEWNKKKEESKILLTAGIENAKEQAEIETQIDEVCGFIEQSIPLASSLGNLTKLVSNLSLGDLSKTFFVIYNNYLFTKHFFDSKKKIKASIERLFMNFSENADKTLDDLYDIEKIWHPAKKKQREVLKRGINENIIVTGKPGTGKTTAVFYLLLALLKYYNGKNENYNIYLTAPSGKAADRVKESVIEAISYVKENHHSEFIEEIAVLERAESYTIHRLLGADPKTNGFKFNKNNKFQANSIFVIDEASMIDIGLFSDLLEAIPDGARVFILGDEHQLPSVDPGAVLSEIVKNCSKKVVELDESNRFEVGSEIFNLAENINNGNPINDINWLPSIEFTIKPWKEKNYPVEHYSNEWERPKDEFAELIKKWANAFYKDTQNKCSNVEFSEDALKAIYEDKIDKKYNNGINEARVLSAENEGLTGVNNINKLIKDAVIDNSVGTKIKGFYPGIPLMITENNKELDLYNGDTGITITFKGCDTLFFLIKKNHERYKKDSLGPVDKIFKLGGYILYPVRMLDLKKVTYAYAITIHKSQGSGYDNILVVLPRKKGHPLLNRQILYTGITRTKGNTYVISNSERFNEAIAKEEKRHTNVFDKII